MTNPETRYAHKYAQMSNIYKQPKSRFWWIKYRSSDGTIKRESLRTPHKGKAVQIQKAMDKGLKDTPKPDPNQSLDGLVDGYLKIVKGTVVTSVYNNLGHRIKRFVRLSNLQAPHQITLKTIQDFAAAMILKKRAAATVRGYVFALNGFCRYLESEGHLHENPCRSVRLPKQKSSPPRFLDESEYAAALEVAKKHGIFLAVLTALKTGMRMSELRKMCWEHIIWRKDGKNLIIIPKTEGKRGRTIPMHPELTDQFKPIKKATGPLFPGEKGGFMGEKQWRVLLKPLQKTIAKFTQNHKGTGTAWHLLRHTCGYRLAMAGVPIPVIKEIFGHKDIKTTMIYARVAPDIWYDEIKKA